MRPLPFHEPEQLVWIANTGSDEGLSTHTVQVNPFLDLKRYNHSYAQVAAYFAEFALM